MFGKKIEKNIKVEGMHCVHCADKVKKALESIKGVKKVAVDVASGNVAIVSKSEIDDNTLVAAIENLGYKIVK